jgi:hypothetical protein
MNDAIGLRKEKKVFFGELAFIGVRLEDCESGAFEVVLVEQGGEVEKGENVWQIIIVNVQVERFHDLLR